MNFQHYFHVHVRVHVCAWDIPFWVFECLWDSKTIRGDRFAQFIGGAMITVVWLLNWSWCFAFRFCCWCLNWDFWRGFEHIFHDRFSTWFLSSFLCIQNPVIEQVQTLRCVCEVSIWKWWKIQGDRLRVCANWDCNGRIVWSY